jgi:hypothetical protein
MDGDSPSIYSQTSANVLSRGPSVSSHLSVRRFSVPQTVLESIIGGGSPIEENDFNPRSQDNRTSAGEETITPATRRPASSPPNRGLDPDSQQQQRQSQLDRNSGLDRQNTTAIATLLKSRQRQSELLPTVHSGVLHIERAGSIKPAQGLITADADHEGVGVVRMSGENSGMGREPYGRRFRRMKAEQGHSGMP